MRRIHSLHYICNKNQITIKIFTDGYSVVAMKIIQYRFVKIAYTVCKQQSVTGYLLRNRPSTPIQFDAINDPLCFASLPILISLIYWHCVICTLYV